MILKSVEIKNVKSIEHCELDIDKGCKVLVGVSESGKSNLLYALSCLNPDVELLKENIKAGTRKSQDSIIDFELEMDSDERKKLLEIILSNIYTSKINKLVQFDGKRMKLDEFIQYHYCYNINIRNNKRVMQYYTLDEQEKYEIDEKHFFVIASESNPVVITNKKTGEKISVCNRVIVSSEEYDIPNDYIVELTAADLNEYFCSFGLKFVKENIPNVLFWEYKEEYLLPASILISDFIENPNINIPLKYIFELCEINDIKSEYEDCLDMGEASFQNLLDDVSDKINKYLRKIWKSMPTTCKLELKENADKLNIRIKDSRNSYLLDKRSDGFKRLMTFMIMLSVKNKNNQLNNTLILIDEPETKIDIPGQEYLKLELINISKNNYIFYSTHSTSMVDTTNIGRHYIVKKENESTLVELANEDNYDSALALYKALGMQVYAVICNKNIVFEGWTDMNIFKVALNSLNKIKKNKFKNVGITHVAGATKFRDFAAFWGLLSRDYYIISDADKTSSELKEAFERDNYTGTWYKYDEFGIEKKVFTVEDFLETKYIIQCAKKFGELNNFKYKINEEQLNNSDISNVICISDWIKYNDNDKSKKLISSFKIFLATNVKKENIIKEYFDMIDGVIDKLSL